MIAMTSPELGYVASPCPIARSESSSAGVNPFRS